jgi:hypothetical protein
MTFNEELDKLQEELNFCICGNPEKNLGYVREGLKFIRSLLNAEYTYEERKQKETEVFGNCESAEFFYYWTDREGLTEHGCAIPGWLTSYGVEFLSKLNSALGGVE